MNVLGFSPFLHRSHQDTTLELTERKITNLKPVLTADTVESGKEFENSIKFSPIAIGFKDEKLIKQRS